MATTISELNSVIRKAYPATQQIVHYTGTRSEMTYVYTANGTIRLGKTSELLAGDITDTIYKRMRTTARIAQRMADRKMIRVRNSDRLNDILSYLRTSIKVKP